MIRGHILRIGVTHAARSSVLERLLKLSLVSCPIAMFPASSSSERVSFRQINKKTGHRLKHRPHGYPSTWRPNSITGMGIQSYVFRLFRKPYNAATFGRFAHSPLTWLGS
jgi:hypothetical protein